MAEYNLTVPSGANSFQHNGTDYGPGDRYETDDSCDALGLAIGIVQHENRCPQTCPQIIVPV